MDNKNKKLDSEAPNSFQRENFLGRSGSFRKVLPTKPSATVDSRLTMSGRMIERPSSEFDRSAKQYAKYFLEYALLAEFELFRKKDIPGVYISPADKDPLVWYGVLFIHEGLFKGAVLRFEVKFPETFPDGDCPRIVFSENIIHPAINVETGDLNVAAEFRKWRKTVNHTWQVLQYARDAFINIDTKAPLNEVAAKLLLENPSEFEKEARLCAAASQENIYSYPNNDDINYIRFDPYDEDIYGGFPIGLQAFNSQ